MHVLEFLIIELD